MIEKSRDFRRIKKVFDRSVRISSDCHYLMETTDREDSGIWVFYPIDDAFEVHTYMNSNCRGHKAARSARNAFNWMWENTAAPIIYAAIPPDKLNVKMLAHLVGFKFMFSKNGNRCYKLERPTNLGRLSA